MFKKLKLLLLFFGLIIFLTATINFYSAGIHHDCALYVLLRTNWFHAFACGTFLTTTCITLILLIITLRDCVQDRKLILICNFAIKFAPAIFVTVFLATAFNVVVFGVLVSILSVYALVAQLIKPHQKRSNRNENKG